MIVGVELRYVITPPHGQKSYGECERNNEDEERKLKQKGVCQSYAEKTQPPEGASDSFTVKNLPESAHETMLLLHHENDVVFYLVCGKG